MNSVLLAAWLAGAAAGEPVDVRDGVPFFTREEPHLRDARDAVEHGDPDLALEHARAAVTSSDDERAIVEYDVGHILVARARADAQAAQQAAAPSTTEPNQPPAAPQPPKLDDARAGFERAAGLAHDPRLISEAQLAAGNAALEMGKLEDAISSLRRALIADRNNVRARRNLQRALELKQQQPPPPESGDGEDSDDKKDSDEQKDGEEGDQKKEGDQPKKDAGKDEGDKKEDESKSDKDGDEQKPGDDQKKDEKKAEPAQQPKKKPTSKEEAKRVLQGIRSRERPLAPLEMRGDERQRPRDGKDW